MAKIVLSKEEIQKACSSIGKSLTEELKNENVIPVAIGIMKGSLNFMMDLIRCIDRPIYTDYLQVSSYCGTKPSGKVTLLRDLKIDIKGRTVILIEDIIDTGISMKFLLNFLHERYQPKRIILCALVDKLTNRKIDIKIDYSGLVLRNDEFLVGYGLDYNEIARNLPDIYGLDAKDVEEYSNLIAKC